MRLATAAIHKIGPIDFGKISNAADPHHASLRAAPRARRDECNSDTGGCPNHRSETACRNRGKTVLLGRHLLDAG